MDRVTNGIKDLKPEYISKLKQDPLKDLSEKTGYSIAIITTILDAAGINLHTLTKAYLGVDIDVAARYI